ncbi:MAG: hypothetical protein R3228_06835 [Halioglobus sp.]|nr:hypothetical protein [Halioglobus sp.]
MHKTQFTRTKLMAGLLGLSSALLSVTASAAIVSQTWVGTWDSTGSGNPTASGGPGMTAGQKYVIRVDYDTGSSVTTADVLDSFFAPSGQQMSTIDLTDPGNSLDIFVPMEGLDSGTPFIYTQDETDHFPAFIPAPTLNFTLGSDISDVNNIIGLEYEGDFVAGANNNIIELFNTTPGAATPINMVSTVLNLGTGPAATDTNGLAVAVPVQVANTSVTYSAADLVKTTALTVQSNDLGAGRSDGETFLSSTWSVTGATQANGVDIEVGIADSGLTNTADTTSWNVTVTEAMTDLSDSAVAAVDYSNASPTASLSAVADAVDIDFTLTRSDLDLAVNALIAGFESVVAISALVDGTLTSFFDPLLATDFMTASHAALEAAFGLGGHTLLITVQDLAGASATATVDFFVQDTGVPPVPVPAPLFLILLGLAMLRRRATRTA